MATQTVQPAHHFSPRLLAMGLAGGVLAVGAGIGVYALVTDEPVATTPGVDLTDTRFVPAQPGSDAYEGWNRETRGLQHRR